MFEVFFCLKKVDKKGKMCNNLTISFISFLIIRYTFHLGVLKMEKTHKQIFGENLERIRKEKGFTRKQLSDFLEMDVNSYGAYERGEKNPPLKKLFKIADYLKVSVIELIGENSESNNKNIEYRLYRATKLITLCGCSLDSSNGTIELTLPDKLLSSVIKIIRIPFYI